MDSFECFKVSDKVVDEEGYRGVIRYIGPVATAKKKDQVWIGVEWETKNRGKHDGSVVEKTSGKTVRYFECADGQGSFVKPQFLKTGITFQEALIRRYEPELLNVSEDQDQDGDQQGEAGPRRRNGEAVAIEAVGMDVIRHKQQIAKLREVSLASSAVATIGHTGWIEDNCPNIKELDLSDNLLDSWAMVGNILKQLKGLEHLSLARNALKHGLPVNPIERLPESMKQQHHSLQVLVLNKTATRFSQIQRLETEGLFPQLEELVLGDNGLTTLDPIADVKSDEAKHQKGSYAEWAKEQIKLVDRKGFTPESFAKGFKNLRKIDISRNNLSSWSEVWRLSRLGALQHINASDNPIDGVFYDKPPQVLQAEADAAAAAATATPAAAAGEPIPENEKLQKQRLKAAKKFEQLVSGHKVDDGNNEEGQLQEEDNKTPEDEDLEVHERGLDIIMSNGTVVPVLEKLEPAPYTEARLFKGDGTDGGAIPFRRLEVLLLCRTRISSWTNIDALNDFPSIKELRLQESPIIALATNAGAARQTVIARIKGLARLNGSDVSERERADAERLYLKRAALQMAEDQSLAEKILAENPRYKELVAIHGDPMDTAKRAQQQQTGGSLASNSAKVTIKSFDPRSCTVPPVTKRLPVTMTVKELKVLCQKLFKVDTELQKLFYREQGKTFGHPTPLEEDIMPIVDYGVKADGEIIMEARDPEKEKADADKRAAQEAQRMRDQEERAKLEANIKRQEVEHAKQSLIN